MVNNIKNNTISEISVNKDLNTLNKIKNTEIIKYRKRTSGQKDLSNLFSDLSDTTLTEKTLKSESQEDKNENEKENEKEQDKEKKKENEHDKTLSVIKWWKLKTK